jgi:hypothetical protein
MEQNADHSVVSAATRRGQQLTSLLPEKLPETVHVIVHVCYVQSYHCVYTRVQCEVQST